MVFINRLSQGINIDEVKKEPGGIPALDDSLEKPLEQLRHFSVVILELDGIEIDLG